MDDAILSKHVQMINGKKPLANFKMNYDTDENTLNKKVEVFINNIKDYSKHLKIVQRNIEDDFEVEKFRFTDAGVKILIPSLNEKDSKFLAAIFRNAGMDARALDKINDKDYLKGRKYVSGKENRILTLILGSILNHLEKSDKNSKYVIYIPEILGMYRLKQIKSLIVEIVKNLGYKNIKVADIDFEDLDLDFGHTLSKKMWQAINISDILEEVKYELHVRARDRDHAIKMYDEVLHMIENSLENHGTSDLLEILKGVVKKLELIELIDSEEYSKVLISGETYIARMDYFTDKLYKYIENKKIIFKPLPLSSMLEYKNFVNSIEFDRSEVREKLRMHAQTFFKNKEEKTIKAIFKKLESYDVSFVDIENIYNDLDEIFINEFTGESKILVGEILKKLKLGISGVLVLGTDGAVDSEYTAKIVDAITHNHIRKLYINLDNDDFKNSDKDNLELFLLRIKKNAKRNKSLV